MNVNIIIYFNHTFNKAAARVLRWQGTCILLNEITYKMKKCLLSLLMLGIAVSAFSQITITQSDMPSSGDTLRYSNTNSIYTWETTGASYTWNFDSLKPSGQGVNSYKSMLSVDPINAVLLGGLSDFGLKVIDSIPLGIVTFKNIYNFFKKTSSKFTSEVYDVSVSGIPLASAYSDPDELYQFPLTYGRIDTSTFDVTLSIPATGNFRMKGTRINEVDGWGTVNTPFGSFPCLRMKSTVTEMDSITITAFSLSLGIPRNSTTFSWLANGIKIPVLEVQGTYAGSVFTATQVRYRDSYRFLPPTANFTANLTVCTTADTVNFTNRTTPGTGNSYNWTFAPASMQYASGSSASSRNPRVNFIDPGYYTVTLRAARTSSGDADDTTAVNYILVSFPSGIASVAGGNGVKVFPIPAGDELTVAVPENMGNNYIVMITDMSGRVSFQNTYLAGNLQHIAVDQLSAGTYLLLLHAADGRSFSTQFIKQ
jgi:PKD repeat protein